MKKFLFILLYVLLTVVGLHFMYEAYILKTHPIDGTGVGFHPFGLDLLVKNEDIPSTSLKTFILGSALLIGASLLVTVNKFKFKKSE